MATLVIVILVVLIIVTIFSLVMYIYLSKKIQHYKTISTSISSMQLINEMFDIMGESLKANEKVKKLNERIIEIFNLKYSTICMFDGSDYEVKATNVEDEYIETIANVANENDFKANVSKNISKYISTTFDKTLLYRSAMERNIKSAMFSPIYYKDIYVGFWLLEDVSINSFDNISKGDLSRLKNNMGIFFENIKHQSIIENADNIDKQTGLYNNIYLYSNSRQIVSSSQNCVICIVCLKNISDVNDKYGRNIGNALLIKAANAIKETVTSDITVIRYSGTKIMIIMPDSNEDNMKSIIERIFTRIKNEVEYINDEKVYIEPNALIHLVLRQGNIEKEVQKMVSYIEDMDNTNTIKII